MAVQELVGSRPADPLTAPRHRARHVVLVGDYPLDPARIHGGVEAVMLYLSRALVEDEQLRVSVVALDRQITARRTDRHGAVEVVYVPASSRPGRLSVRENIRSLRDQIIHLRPDLVHAHGTSEYATAAAECGVPWVLTIHGIRYQEVALRPGLINRYRSWMVARDEYAVIRRANTIIAINPHVQAVFGKRLGGDVHVIDNPIDEAFFHLPDRRQPGHILFVGRLNARKDVMTLLHAFADLYAQFPAARLRLAGSGDVDGEPSAYYLELRRFVTESGLDQVVTFLGALDDATLREEYAECAVLALSSKVETAPMAITQAMAAGKPVVSTDAGGARHLIVNGETGWVVPVQDSRALSQALRRVLQDETGAAEMGRRAKRLAEQRFRAAVVAQQTKAVYEIAASHV